MPEDYLVRAQHWGKQLSALFGWWLVIEFGLASLVVGVVAAAWPATPEVLATSTGIWLMLLAGCRGFAALALRAAGWARRAALVESAICVGTALVVLHAEWPARASANAISLTFAAAVVTAGALLDAVLARFGPRERARPLLIRAVGWLVAALTLMGLMNVSEPIALSCAAVLVGMVEIGNGVWVLAPASPALHRPAAVEPQDRLGFWEVVATYEAATPDLPEPLASRVRP